MRKDKPDNNIIFNNRKSEINLKAPDLRRSIPTPPVRVKPDPVIIDGIMERAFKEFYKIIAIDPGKIKPGSLALEGWKTVYINPPRIPPSRLPTPGKARDIKPNESRTYNNNLYPGADSGKSATLPGAGEDTKKRPYPRDPYKWNTLIGRKLWKTLDIKNLPTSRRHLLKDRDDDHPLIVDTMGPLPGGRKRNLKAPSPYPCPYQDHIPDVELSKHYSGWKVCSYRGQYFKKPRNKPGLKYCTNNNPNLSKNRRFNCQEVQRWRQRHPEAEKISLTLAELEDLTLNHWIRGAFGKKITIPGQPPRQRIEYFNREELKEFRQYCKGLLKYKTLEDIRDMEGEEEPTVYPWQLGGDPVRYGEYIKTW